MVITYLFCAPKSGVSYKFQSANRSKGKARLDYIQAKQADRRLIRCVCVRRSPIMRHQNRITISCTQKSASHAGPHQIGGRGTVSRKLRSWPTLARLMTDPNLRCEVANAMIAALPPIPDGTCISDIATDMADVMLSTAVEMVPRSKRPRGAQGWCAGSGVKAEMNAAWQQREGRGGIYAQNPTTTFERP